MPFGPVDRGRFRSTAVSPGLSGVPGTPVIGICRISDTVTIINALLTPWTESPVNRPS